MTVITELLIMMNHKLFRSIRVIVNPTRLWAALVSKWSNILAPKYTVSTCVDEHLCPP